jgi:cysteine synthase A
MDKITKAKFDEARQLIGNTPMVAITYRYKKKEPRTLYFKLEYYNLSGSIKDRMALNILETAYKNNKIESGCKIVETTSGNTGIAFCALGGYLGHEVIIYMPEWMSDERKNMIKSLGGSLRLVGKRDGGFRGCLEQAEELAKCGGVFCPRQFANEDNTACHFLTTGPEIARQLRAVGRTCDAVVAGVGTGGTIMGLSGYFKATDKGVKAYPLEPLSSPTMSTGYQTGKHRIEGISDEFIPPIVRLDELNDIIAVDDGDAIILAQQLGRRLGLGVGISSGANFIGAVMAQNMLGADKTVASVFCDDNKKYLSTDLLKKEPVKDTFLSNDIELLEYKTIR